MNSDFQPEWIIVHCLATPPSMTYADAYWTDRLHRSKGWLGCGYQEVITRPHNGAPAMRQNHAGGFPTRPITRPGAHVGDSGPSWNRKCIGISYAGGVDENMKPEGNATPEQLDLLWEAIEEYREMFNIPLKRVIGHRDLIKMTNSSPKACPSFSVKDWIAVRLGKTEPWEAPSVRFGGSFATKSTTRGPLAIPTFHEVKEGDTLWRISVTYGVSLEDILRFNKATDLTASIYPGDTIRLRP